MLKPNALPVKMNSSFELEVCTRGPRFSNQIWWCGRPENGWWPGTENCQMEELWDLQIHHHYQSSIIKVLSHKLGTFLGSHHYVCYSLSGETLQIQTCLRLSWSIISFPRVKIFIVISFNYFVLSSIKIMCLHVHVIAYVQACNSNKNTMKQWFR